MIVVAVMWGMTHCVRLPCALRKGLCIIYTKVSCHITQPPCVCVCVCVKVCVLSRTPLSQHLCLAIYSCLQLNCALHSSYYSVRQNVKAPIAMDDKHRNRASSQKIVRHTHTHINKLHMTKPKSQQNILGTWTNAPIFLSCLVS